jgi:hypothetical protein
VRNGKIHVELLGKLGSSEELDRSNLKSIDRIIFDRLNFPRTDSYKNAPKHPLRSFFMTKSDSPPDFRGKA